MSGRNEPRIRRRLPDLFLPVLLLLLGGGLAALPGPVAAGVYYVSPAAPPGGDGSRDAPWRDLARVLTSGRVSGGDELRLLDGEYGFVKVGVARFSEPVLIAPAPGARVHFDALHVVNASGLIFRGLKIWPRPGAKRQVRTLVRAYAGSSRIRFERLEVRGREDGRNYRQWRKEDWREARAGGILIQGPDSTVRDSTLYGVFHGVQASGARARLVNNRVFGFDGDGLRALGDFSLIRGNVVRDCVEVDTAQHDDGFQSWSLGPDGRPDGGTVTGLVIENNIIEEWRGPREHPFICSLQGIFMKGYLDDLLVQNNVLSVSAWHGITAYGVKGGRILNNTLINARGPSGERPWIGLFGFQLRGASEGRGPQLVTVANNLAHAVRTGADGGAGVTLLGNRVVSDTAALLVDPLNGDYRPRPGSGLIDAGDGRVAPRQDIIGTARPLGARPDIGAYEIR